MLLTLKILHIAFYFDDSSLCDPDLSELILTSRRCHFRTRILSVPLRQAQPRLWNPRNIAPPAKVRASILLAFSTGRLCCVYKVNCRDREWHVEQVLSCRSGKQGRGCVERFHLSGIAAWFWKGTFV